MPQTIEPVILESEVIQADSGIQTVILTLRYSGTVDLSDKFTVNNQLSIEVPSHAPPPEQ